MSPVPEERDAAVAQACTSPTAGACARAEEAEARVQRLVQELDQIVEVANDAFVAVDASGAITGWSRQAERLLGWARAEVVGRQFAIIPPDVRAGRLTGIDELMVTDGDLPLVTRFELQAQHRDGHLIPVEVTVWPAPPGSDPRLNAFVRDLTPGGRGGDASCRMGSIIESSEDAIIGASLDGRILTWNGGAEAMYGYAADVIVGHPLWLLAPFDLQAQVRAYVEGAASGDLAVHHLTVRRRADGSTLEVDESVALTRDTTGAPTGISMIARDVTKQRQMAAALEAALDEARESESRSRRFLADVAHQLRTPITGIQACAQAILRGAGQAERDELLAGVVQETSRAARLMAALLQMARLDRGEVLNPAPCDLYQLCQDEVDRTRRLAPALRVAIESPPDWHEKPELDANAVVEILGNLLDNARRHAASTITITIHSSEDEVGVRVVDDGHGLAPDMAERVFERFVSLDGKGGSGLGLPIARGLARAHGGDVVYDSGAFVLRLPRRPRTPDEGSDGE